MKITSGFTLIELLLALAISALIGGILLIAFANMNRMMRFVDATTEMHMRVTMALHQFEKDLTGVVVPAREPDAVPAKDAQNTKEDPKKAPKVTHLFYAARKKELFDMVTFLTVNPMAVYWQGATGEAKPRMARVVYRLAPQASQSSPSAMSSYILLRQESSNLDFEAFKKEQNTPGAIRAVEVMRNIKSLKIMYTAEIIKRPDQAQKKEHAQERSYKKMSEWQREPKETEQKEDDDQFKDVPSILPRLVTVELTVWDAQHKRDKMFSTTILIPTDTVIQISEHKREQLKTDEESAMAVAFGPEVARKENAEHIIQIRAA